MSDVEEVRLFQQSFKQWGEQNRWDKLIEEMGELQQAIIKHRYKKKDYTLEHLIEELADVSILVDTMKEVLRLNGCGGDLRSMRAAKIEKLRSKLEEDTF